MNDADWIRLLSEQSPRELSDDEAAKYTVKNILGWEPPKS